MNLYRFEEWLGILLEFKLQRAWCLEHMLKRELQQQITWNYYQTFLNLAHPMPPMISNKPNGLGHTSLGQRPRYNGTRKLAG